MPRVHRVSLALLLTLAILAIAGPAAAHIVSPAVVLPTAEAPAIIPVLSAAPAPPALPWYLFAALAATLALVAGALWRRPRGALVVALTLLLCVFAFEHALHSVHHGFDPKQQEECTVAAASAHLAAVQVDDLGLSSVVLPVIGPAEAAPPASPLARFLSPDQGRAPPSAIL
jgi:fumarate reductase subunit D